VRPKQPRPEPPQHQNGSAGLPHPGGGQASDLEVLSGGSRRARRRARKLAAQRVAGGGGVGPQGAGRPGFTVEGTGGGRGATGVDAWIAEPMPPAPKSVEYRMQVRGSSLTVSILDPDARMPLSATGLLAFQAQ